MNYNEYISVFKKQLETLSFEKQFNLAVIICKKLYFDYEIFVDVHQWGDPNLLMDAIRMSEQGMMGTIGKNDIDEMLQKVNAIIPHMDDFGDEISSYGLNASASVYEMLEFLIDNDKNHIYNIGTYLTDTTDFKIQEEKTLTENEIDKHPMMIQARQFVLDLCR